MAAAVFGLAGRKIGLVPLVSYIAAGFLIGPNVLGWVHDADRIETIAHIGLILLLYRSQSKLFQRSFSSMEPD